MNRGLRLNYEYITKHIIRNPDIKMAEKAIIWDMLQYWNINGQCFPSQETLALHHGVSTRHIRRILAKLKNRGFIFHVKKRGYSQSNQYIFQENFFLSRGTSRSLQTGTTAPTYIGHSVPPNNYNNKLEVNNTYEDLFVQFQNVSGTPSTSDAKKHLFLLIQKHGKLQVEEGIKKAVSQTTHFNTKYLEKVLNNSGSSVEKKPPFVPCGKNGCNNGMLLDLKENTATPCQCRREYEKLYKKGSMHAKS